ncbi:signal peptide peptidase SppA [Marinilabiliaceae bacterium ANBcel2]|nr:signal peptide peptidase SppA [Marinilabiliaceae bacterium ANBcel2]
MSRFLKYLLAVIVGSMVSALFFISGIVIFIAVLASSTSQEIKVKDNSVLVLNIDGAIVERKSEDIFDMLLSDLTGQVSVTGLNQILTSIEKAKRDDRIDGIYLDASYMSAGYGTIEEIRDALLDFKESGKFIYAYSSIYSQKTYYLASVADKIYLNPAGMLDFKGLSSNRTFFKGALDKLDIEMQIFKHGEFKSAVEPFILEEMSEESRLQTERYLETMWQHVVTKIGEARDIDPLNLDRIANEGVTMFMEGDELVENSLIDAVKYKDEVLNKLKRITSVAEEDDLNSIGVRKYADVYVPRDRPGIPDDKVAVIYADGAIDAGSSGISSESLSRTIRKARRDSMIKAVVLRINSPGGSGLGSEIIWREVNLTKKEKPVVVSMGDVAASGGYYIAAPADVIVAGPTTLTGSIGVFGQVPNTRGLLNKLGITTDRVTTHNYSDFLSVDRPMSDDEKRIFQGYIERFYEIFLDRCSQGRDMTTEEINQIGEGRVWSGVDAVTNGLVDENGGLNFAIDRAVELAELEEYRIVELPEILTAFERLMKDIGQGASAFGARYFMGSYYDSFIMLNELESSHPVQARMPYNIYVN